MTSLQQCKTIACSIVEKYGDVTAIPRNLFVINQHNILNQNA